LLIDMPSTGDQPHSILLEVDGTEPPEVMVGGEFVLKVRLSCPAGCRLAGAPVRVTVAGQAAEPCALSTESDGALEIGLKAPPQAGKHVWNIGCEAHEADGIRHEPTSVPVSISAMPYATSLAVWNIPSPVVTGERFSIRVGAKSAADVGLAGRQIDICDQADTCVAQGRLAEAPLPGTSALYWTDVELAAPTKPGMHAFSAAFAPTDLELAHEGAAFKFNVVAVEPPEHKLTVRVIESASAAPIEDMQVRLGVYRAATDRSGRAEIALPKGSYELAVWKVGYDAPPKTVVVNDDVIVEVAVTAVPEEDPDAAWMM
jgi:hypothetical protein